MSVKIYINRDAKGRPAAPEYSHEMLSTVDIVKRLWAAFHHHPTFYAVAANLRQPSADLLIMSERGLGVMELKHYYGRITCRTDGSWHAGPIRMQAGVAGKGFKNPHEQVQAYAEEIRKKLLAPPVFQEPWLPGKAIEWPDFKFHTAVCFTHPDADVKGFSEALRKRCRPITLPWEDFSVFRVEEITRWVAALRFEVGGERSKGFTRHRLTPRKIERIAIELLGLHPWTELEDLVPVAEPYAYLTLWENGERVQVFSLENDDVLIGRDLKACDLLIPDRFLLVSRVHARITRTIKGAYLEDMSSTNGTYLDKRRVTKKRLLSEGKTITLGGAEPGENVCQLEFSFHMDRDTLEKTQKLAINQK